MRDKTRSQTVTMLRRAKPQKTKRPGPVWPRDARPSRLPQVLLNAVMSA